MSNTTTTKTAAKIAKRKHRKSTFLPRTPKAYSRKELAAEFNRLTGEIHDPGYLADIANGTRMNHRLEEAVKQAVANLNLTSAKNKANI